MLDNDCDAEPLMFRRLDLDALQLGVWMNYTRFCSLILRSMGRVPLHSWRMILLVSFMVLLVGA
jgi:hypothetical protein